MVVQATHPVVAADFHAAVAIQDVEVDVAVAVVAAEVVEEGISVKFVSYHKTIIIADIRLQSSMKPTLIIVTLILIWFNLSGQTYSVFGIKANAGLSKITTDRGLTNSSTKNNFAFSGQGGLVYNLGIGKHSKIGAELLYNQVNGTDETKTLFNDVQGNPTGGYSNTVGTYQIHCLTVPVCYGFQMNKLNINLGVQTSYMMRSKGHFHTEFVDNTGTYVPFPDSEGKLNIDPFEFGARAGLMFNVTDHIVVEATYYHGVTNILSTTAPDTWDFKIQQMVLGLRYNLFWTAK